MIFIHDYFNFVIYENQTLNPISLEDIAHYTTPNELTTPDTILNGTTPSKSPKEQMLLSLAKRYVIDHIKSKLEPPSEKKKATQTLLPLEFNLIPLICFISLKLMHEPVFPKDIIGWIKSGYLPYLSAYKDIPTEGLKSYLIKPISIPSSNWIRTTYREFLELYQIGYKSTARHNEKVIERIFKDCGLPEVLIDPSKRLYHLFCRSRRNYEVKHMDEDYVIVGVIIAVLKLFYGFDDNFYAVFLKPEKIQEIFDSTQDAELEETLSFLYEQYKKFTTKDLVIGLTESLPKFDDLIYDLQEKFVSKNFNKYYNEIPAKLPWNYKDLSKIYKKDIEEQIDQIKDQTFSDTDYQEFLRLQEIFQNQASRREQELEEVSDSNNDRIKVETNEDYLIGQASGELKKPSEWIEDELHFFSELKKSEATNPKLANEKLTVPSDNFFLIKKFNSMPLENHKYEFLFILNFFSVYMEESVDAIEKGLKFVERNLLRLGAKMPEYDNL